MVERTLKFGWINSSEQTPNEYRLATVEEVQKHSNTIARLGIPPLNPQHPPIEGGKEMYLLDGYLTYPSPSDGHFHLEQTFYPDAIQKVVVKEREWHKYAWRTKSTACYSSDGVLLRKQLYDGIRLTTQARQIALLNSCENVETEVLYWLLKTTWSLEWSQFKRYLSTHIPMKSSYNDYYRSIVDSFFRCSFPLQLPLEPDSHGNTHIDYVIEMINNVFVVAKHNGNAILFIVDLLVELFSVKIVHSKNRDGISLLDIAEKNKSLSHLFTKLLSISQGDVENHSESIKRRFNKVFYEAFRRGYVPLLEKLLDFIMEMTIDVPWLIRELSRSEAVDRRYYSLVMKLSQFKVYEQISRDEFVEVLRRAVCKGHRECVQKLLELAVSKVEGKLVMEVDENEKTLIHCAAESGDGEIFHLLLQKFQSHASNLQGGKEESQNIARNRDKFGRSILHLASLVGDENSCNICVKEWKLKVETKDSSGQNSLHSAAKGMLGHQVVNRLIGFSSKELIHSRDYKGRTPLHLASAVGNIEMVQKLLHLFIFNHTKSKYIRQSDSFGRTAMHMAVRGGHQHLVQLLLEGGSEPLKERDMHGQTPLHYATQIQDPEVAVALSRRLLKKYKDPEKSLLMWASAAGIGTAEEIEQTHPNVRTFLKEEKASDKTHLLRAAAVTNNEEMAWELVNRGANLVDLHNYDWRKTLSSETEKNVDKNVDNVLEQIALANKRGHDKPSLEDKLGRSTFAEGLAALFLNKFIESPMTIGIFGDWGMGKSSLMIQTEQILLMAASQLTFPNLLMLEKFEGAEEISLNNKGIQIYQNYKKGVSKLLCQEENNSSEIENPLVNLLKNYHPQYHGIYKSIACMDQNQMLKLKSNRSIIQDQSQVLRGVPRILTIQYNAWHYRNEQEAWTGLAIRISEEIEKSMTRSQRFTTLWKYNWKQHRMTICLQVFIPCFFVAFISGWVAWGAWVLLSKGEIKELTYGSIPCTVVAIVWIVLKSIISVVKPVSIQMMDYITSPYQNNTPGYQQKVIFDINFLKKEIGRKPGWFFSFISGEWCWNWFGLSPDNIENTSISKFRPASEDNLRIITFVDDLDRCEEKVILQVLSAINLVLAECKINVILGMDKKMIQRAIRNNFGDTDDRDLVERFICKIIQIPLSLPDPTEEESNNFLENQLGQPLTTTTPAEDGGETDYGEIESGKHKISSQTYNHDVMFYVVIFRVIKCYTNVNYLVLCTANYCVKDVEENAIESEVISDVNQNATASAVVDICCSSRTQTSCEGITKKLLKFWLCKCLIAVYLFVCDILREYWHFGLKSNHEKIPPLTFSKGARLSREMLSSNYCREEVDIFSKLKSFATDNQKLPREWKRLLNYQKLACNILCRQGKVYSLPGWKEQLVAWIFVCWQWKHEMNTLFKDWHRYAVVSSTDETGDEVENHERWHGPSLKTIVTNYIRQEERSDITSVKENESWSNLQAALGKQDVTMKGIQLFQQFRLHCETRHLPWPLPQSNQKHKEAYGS